MLKSIGAWYYALVYMQAVDRMGYNFIQYAFSLESDIGSKQSGNPRSSS